MVVRQDSFLPTKQMHESRKNSTRAIDVPITTGSRAPASPRRDGPIDLDEPLEKSPNDNRSTGAT